MVPEVDVRDDTNLVGAAFNVTTLRVAEGVPKTSPDFGLTNMEYLLPGFNVVNEYFVVTTETTV